MDFVEYLGTSIRHSFKVSGLGFRDYRGAFTHSLLSIREFKPKLVTCVLP